MYVWLTDWLQSLSWGTQAGQELTVLWVQDLSHQYFIYFLARYISLKASSSLLWNVFLMSRFPLHRVNTYTHIVQAEGFFVDGEMKIPYCISSKTEIFFSPFELKLGSFCQSMASYSYDWQCFLESDPKWCIFQWWLLRFVKILYLWKKLYQGPSQPEFIW